MGVLAPEMYYALFGAGHFAIVNAARHGAECLGTPSRVLLVLAAFAVWPIALAGVAVATPRRLGRAPAWVRHAPLAAHVVLALSGALSAVDHGHVTPLLLLLVAQFLVVRHDLVDALIAVVCATPFGLVTAFVNVAVRVHEHSRPLECGTALSAGALLCAGALHAHPLAALWLETGDDAGAAVAAAVHAAVAVLACLHDGVVWIPTLLGDAYVDMLVGGVSAHEAWTLAVQVALGGLSAVAGVWVLARLTCRASVQRLDGPLAAEPFATRVFVAVGLALFLTQFDFLVTVCVYGAVLVGTLLCHAFAVAGTVDI